jgi:hypothetical protein
VNRLGTSLIAEAQGTDLCQTALDLAMKIRMWFYAVNEEDCVGAGGNRIQVGWRAVVTLTDQDSVHCRLNLHANLGLRYAEMIEKLNLAGDSGPTMRTH